MHVRGITAALVLLGCSPAPPNLDKPIFAKDAERYVIVGNDTYFVFNKELAIDPRRDDELIATVRAFSTENGMDFLLARESLANGDFNVSANGPLLNFHAMHIGIFDENVVVTVVSRFKPTDEDRRLAAEFVCRLEENCLK